MPVKLPNIELAEREPLAAEIARKLLGYLFSGEIGPGERLPSERQLAQSLGVGRSAVREALKALGFLGMLESRHGGGTYLKGTVSELLPQVVEWGLLLREPNMLDLVEARRHIEVVVAGLAAQRRDQQAIKELRGLLHTMAASSADPERFVEADMGFHLSLAKASGNSVLNDVLASIQSLLRAWIRRVIQAAGETGSSYEEHVPIFEAVESGEPEAARAAMTRHMEGASVRLMRTLQDSGGTPTQRELRG
jgi:GntR family transcriptional regulator, transcriptional repressor for pyruvate dehydrogenase complex